MNLVIYFIAFLEGFTTLSVEIVALRIFTPIIGSNSISTSIILGVILLALSYGYYIGGKLSLKKDLLVKRLFLNLLISASYYFFISFIFSSFVLIKLLSYTHSYFFSILISSIILFFIPVFLASQTIPLLSEILKGKTSGEKMGKLLFYSTIGSFLGSVLTSSFFFPVLGVFKSAILAPIILSFCALLIAGGFSKNMKFKFIAGAFLLFFLYFSLAYKPYENPAIIYKKANAYHNIDVYNKDDSRRIFSLNGSYSSGIDIKTKKSFFSYVKEAETIVKEIKAEKILVLGAAGFSFPNDVSSFDFVQQIDVVDVDPDLKEIAEKYFLEKKLSSKIKFYSMPARYFLNNNTKTYDFIMVDAYSGKAPPAQMITYEFFKKLKSSGNHIYLNTILDAQYKNDFSKNLLNTVSKAFGESYYKNVNNRKKGLTNVAIINKYKKGYTKNKINSDIIYSDNKNSIELDIFKQFLEIYKK